MKQTRAARGTGLMALVLAAGLIMACAQPESPKPVTPPAETGTASLAVFLGTSTGTAVASGSTQVGKAAIFGGASAVTVGSTTFTIKNTGTETASLTGVTATVAAGSKFAVTTAPASSVAAGGTTTFVVTYTPTAVGTDSVVVSVASTPGTTLSFTLGATATATAAPVLSVSSASGPVASAGSVDFGKVELGVAVPMTLTVTNVGTASATGVAASLAGSTDYSITANTATTLAIGDTTTLVLGLTPVKTATGVRTATLTVANSGTAYTASLTATGIVTSKVYYVTMPGTPLTATQHAANFANGTFLTFSSYGSTSNNFYWTSPNYYGRGAQSFIMFPTLMTGDFSISATILDLGGNTSAASGMAIGMTSGFAPTDKYAYALITNAVAGATAPLNAAYVSASGVVTNAALTTVTAGATATVAAATAGTITNSSGTLTSTLTGTPTALTFNRTGANLNLGVSTGTLATLPASAATDGTTVFGTGAVYPCLSFVRNFAQVTNLVIKDGSGNVVYDSANGGSLGTYYPAAVSLSASAANTNVGSTTTVTATATGANYDAAGAAVAVTATSSSTAVATVAVNGSTITVTGVAAGTATITVTNSADTTKTATLAVTITQFSASDGYGALTGSTYPAPGATNAYTDGELALTFDAPPTLVTGGLIKIYKKSDGTEVDNIAFKGEVQNVPTSATTTTAINVGTQLVRVSGNILYITPHFGKLAYGTAYYVAIPNGSITGTLKTVAFTGLSNDKAVATWSFTTQAAPTLGASITVDGSQTSTANFRTLGGALMALAQTPPAGTAIAITVAAGTYNELVQYRPATADLTKTITIKGPTGTAGSLGSDTIIQYANNGVANATQQMRASFYFAGANLVLQNLTLKNTAVRVSSGGQAEALYFDSRLGSTMAASNCSFISNQDTINTTGRNWFYKCFIQGNTDFIWGTADAALFESCSLRVFNDGGTLTSPFAIMVARTNGMTSAGAYSGTAGSGFSGLIGKGYVLLNSTVAVDDGCTAVFGRDAGTGVFFDQVALVNNTFSATGTTGTIGTGLWTTSTAPLSLGDSTYVGWKAVGNTGLNLSTLTTATGTAATIASQATEYATRDQVLNNVVVVNAGAPSGYQASPLGSWNVTALATAFGAP